MFAFQAIHVADQDTWRNHNVRQDDFSSCPEELKVRQFHEETDEASIIIDSGADVALFPLHTSEFGTEGLNLDSETKLQDAQGNRIASRDIEG